MVHSSRTIDATLDLAVSPFSVVVTDPTLYHGIFAEADNIKTSNPAASVASREGYGGLGDTGTSKQHQTV